MPPLSPWIGPSAALLMLLSGCSEPEESLDLLLEGGLIQSEGRTIGSALGLRDGRVVALDAEAESLAGPGTERIDLAGQVVSPGFIDAHVHLLAGSFVLDKVLLVGVSSMSTVVQKTSDYLEESPDAEWVVGYGWVISLMDDADGRALDAVSGDTPVALFDGSGHALMVNSKAMEIAGIDAQTPDPPGGEILRDPETGEPTGILLEAAIELVSPVVLESITDQALMANLEEQIADFRGKGLTAVAEILAVPGVDLGRPWVYKELEDAGALDLRISYSMPVFSEEDLERVLDARAQWDGELLRFAGAKVWVDGSISSGEAWSLEPGVGSEDHFGSHYWDREGLITLIMEAEAQGYGLKLHTNGDAAIQATLEALETCEDALESLQQRYTLEHAVLIAEGDMERIRELGVSVSVQPAHVLAGSYGVQAELWSDGRHDHSWDFPGLADAGVELALGTDWPVWPEADPVLGLWAAVDGVGERALSSAEALRAATYGGARAQGREGELGCLEPGCLADFVILDRDPLALSAGEMTSLDVEQVWLAGERVD